MVRSVQRHAEGPGKTLPRGDTERGLPGAHVTMCPARLISSPPRLRQASDGAGSGTALQACASRLVLCADVPGQALMAGL